MKAVIQRVTQASVTSDGKILGSIGQGFLILLGVQPSDNQATAEKLWNKISKLRIFEDDAGKTGASLSTIGGSVLIVSQFTLYADVKKGNRPSFTQAAPPKQAEELYDYFVEYARQSDVPVETGSFGAYMNVELANDGPFTIIIDTDNLSGN